MAEIAIFLGLTLLGVGFVACGIGYWRNGVPVRGDRRLTGGPAKLVGTLTIVAGVGLCAFTWLWLPSQMH